MSDLGSELDRLATEQARTELTDLDSRDTYGLVKQIADDDACVPRAVAGAREDIAVAVDAIAERMREGGRLIYVGAGTPGRLAVVDASECVPTFGTAPDQVLAVMAGGRAAMFCPVEGAEDDERAGTDDLEATGVCSADAVVGVTASGRTPYVLSSVDCARRAGAVTIGISNNPSTRLSGNVDIPIEVCTGPEVIAGSTRMKAGTAQKLVLNALSTATMVRLGKTYGPFMVDVRATNAKLRARAQRMVSEATGVGEGEAARALEEGGGNAKIAIVSLLAGIDVPAASQYLRDCGGHVRDAVRVGLTR